MKKLLLGLLVILLVFVVKVDFSHAETQTKETKKAYGLTYKITYEDENPNIWTLTVGPDSSTVIKDFDANSANSWVPSSDRSKLKKIVIEEGITRIGNYAFSQNAVSDYITEVEFPSTLKEIGDYSFYKSTQLSTVSLPTGVVKIGKYAFASCSRLASVTLPNSLLEIGEKAFYSCDFLHEIIIPGSVTSIGTQAFNAQIFKFTFQNVTLTSDYVLVKDLSDAWLCKECLEEKSAKLKKQSNSAYYRRID